MHYFIDGYNLLFRLKIDAKDLQTQRQALIYDLNQKISPTKLEVSIVFDATFQKGDRSRSHFNHLEILFTASGETADEYILDMLSHLNNPQQKTIVTSDRGLARQARDLGAQTESIDFFFTRLNRLYKNKQRSSDLKKIPPPSSLPIKKQSKPLLPQADSPLEAYSNYYLEVFEAEWQELVQQDILKRRPKATPGRRPKRVKPAFPELPTPEINASTEMERWLKTFESLNDHSSQFPNS